MNCLKEGKGAIYKFPPDNDGYGFSKVYANNWYLTTEETFPLGGYGLKDEFDSAETAMKYLKNKGVAEDYEEDWRNETWKQEGDEYVSSPSNLRLFTGQKYKDSIPAEEDTDSTGWKFDPYTGKPISESSKGKKMEQVTLKAADGSTGQCQVVESKDGKVKVMHIESKKTYELTKAVFESSLIEDQLDESSHHPSAAIWPNQMVRVYDRNTNKQVDQGLVTQVNAESVFIHTEEYKRGSFDFLILA